MQRLVLVAGLVGCVLVTGLPAAWADLVITGRTTSQSLGVATEAEFVTRFKGLRMRSDLTVRDEQLSTIVDLEAGRFVSLNHKAREAQVYDMRGVVEAVERATDPGVVVDLSPTGREKPILGHWCVEYGLIVRVGVATAPVAGEGVTMVMRGAVWIAPASPGKVDWARFYMRAAESRLSFGDPRAAQVDPGRTAGLTALYRRIAEVGVAYGAQVDLGVEGQGALAAGMRRMGGSSVANVVTGVWTGPVADAVFAIPPGYTTKSP